jgi:hypothetical protein
MVLEILVGVQQWDSIKNAVLNYFEQSIYELLSSGTSAPQMCKIVLPTSVTTAERHKLHILTRPGFKPESFGYNSERYMVLNISKDYFEYLHEVYKQPEPEPEPEPFVLPPPNRPENQLEALKKALLDDIMNIVEKHLNEQFLKFYV